MTAGNYNIKIEQGSTFSLPLTFYTDSTKETTVDFTDYTWRMQIRDKINSENFIIELTSENGKIDITQQDVGIIILSLTATETTAFDFEVATYDLEAVYGSTVSRKIYGDVILSKEVTR